MDFFNLFFVNYKCVTAIVNIIPSPSRVEGFHLGLVNSNYAKSQ